jgi:hypothetical protein
MSPPGEPASAAPESTWAPARRHWEVLAAVATLGGVLLVIDAASIRQPALVLSLAPLGFLVFAALFPLTLEGVAAWVAALAGFALTTGDARYAGLAYTGVAVALALIIRNVFRGRGAPS